MGSVEIQRMGFTAEEATKLMQAEVQRENGMFISAESARILDRISEAAKNLPHDPSDCPFPLGSARRAVWDLVDSLRRAWAAILR